MILLAQLKGDRKVEQLLREKHPELLQVADSWQRHGGIPLGFGGSGFGDALYLEGLRCSKTALGGVVSDPLTLST